MSANSVIQRAVLFDLDETLVITNAIEHLRKRPWEKAYAAFSKTQLPNGTPQFLEKLSRIAKLGVVTKAPRPYAERLLSYHGIKIPVIVAYHDVKIVKPNPEGLLLAAQKLGLKGSSCIYVGDDANDVTAARSAQFTPIGIAWGPQVDIGVAPIYTSWDEVYDEILRLIQDEHTSDEAEPR
jgi:HAD superfamily hydrolase (TIGR01549 family)